VSERVEEQTTELPVEELLPESVSAVEESQPLESQPQPQAEAPVERTVSWLRVAYCIIFLLAVLSIFTVWSEVGGQGHLDMMPWYTKMICVLVSAWCCVRLAAGMVEQRSAWNRRSVAWLAGLILVAFTMAAITYYYHLHEENDQSDTDENTATAMTPNTTRMMRSFW